MPSPPDRVSFDWLPRMVSLPPAKVPVTPAPRVAVAVSPSSCRLSATLPSPEAVTVTMVLLRALLKPEMPPVAVPAVRLVEVDAATSPGMFVSPMVRPAAPGPVSVAMFTVVPPGVLRSSRNTPSGLPMTDRSKTSMPELAVPTVLFSVLPGVPKKLSAPTWALLSRFENRTLASSSPATTSAGRVVKVVEAPCVTLRSSTSSCVVRVSASEPSGFTLTRS